MRDLLLAGLDLRPEPFLNALRRLYPSRILHLSSPNAIRAEGIDDGADLSVIEARADALGLDCFVLPADLSVENCRLVALDMDSTLIENECIDDMAEIAGCPTDMARMTREAMEGRWPFIENLTKRVSLLEGAPESIAAAAAGQIRFSPGTKTLIDFMRSHGAQAWIISGGFSQITQKAVQALGMSGAICNELEAENGRLTGRVLGPAGGKIIDAGGKRRALEVLAQASGLSLSQTMALGDGANDVEMLAAAGFGIAYHAKPVAEAAARWRIRSSGLDAAACFFREFWTAADVL